MAKPNIAGKLKNLARDLKDENKQVKQAEAKKKPINDEKVSGRKN